jgi:hypothetical protein
MIKKDTILLHTKRVECNIYYKTTGKLNKRMKLIFYDDETQRITTSISFKPA